MIEQKTHRLVERPQISARFLADYMSSSPIKRRSIITGCKYQSLARVVQHDEAKQSISKFLRTENPQISDLKNTANKLRSRLADDDFERDLYDHNADYIDQFVKKVDEIELPLDVERLVPGKSPSITLGNVKVTADIQMRLRRLTKTNKVKIGALMLRYSKGKALKPETGVWQSAFLMGYLGLTSTEEGAEPEHKLCITVDIYGGVSYCAPTDSLTKFKHLEAECLGIAERWDKIPPPPKAIF
ncbi:hypothetical protein RFM41_26560 [Mesorhizobium sp. VK25A]|uniref:Uncharacterized protein n=1 Tax=Mesorhizobium vachelliae TaxID=3072309 RepID=A0ABU5AD69_9HYPH|nr:MULTISPECIES: hypothetical protein [unclassified Mesorhizobium]MDX8534778.1 hypothetical protein [Mesorhizobium sp. VK25D]MDX8547339.1 hypothetical protein [Mesorhizobium sp. VK25A]